jgi:hypothetical protein
MGVDGDQGGRAGLVLPADHFQQSPALRIVAVVPPPAAAIIAAAGLINACLLTDRKLSDIKVVVNLS